MELTDSNAIETIESGKPVVIDFWATWCGPCKALSPIMDKLAQEYEGRVVIGKYNTEENNDLCADYMVMALPTLLFFKDGKQALLPNGKPLRIAGGVKESTVREAIEQLLAL